MSSNIWRLHTHKRQQGCQREHTQTFDLIFKDRFQIHLVITCQRKFQHMRYLQAWSFGLKVQQFKRKSWHKWDILPVTLCKMPKLYLSKSCYAWDSLPARHSIVPLEILICMKHLTCYSVQDAKVVPQQILTCMRQLTCQSLVLCPWKSWYAWNILPVTLC